MSSVALRRISVDGVNVEVRIISICPSEPHDSHGTVQTQAYYFLIKFLSQPYSSIFHQNRNIIAFPETAHLGSTPTSSAGMLINGHPRQGEAGPGST